MIDRFVEYTLQFTTTMIECRIADTV